MADLETEIRAAFEGGAEEIVIRVSRYGPDCKTPEAYQALVKFRIRQRAWWVGILRDPIAALKHALGEGERCSKPKPQEDVFG